jgi:hypothetical protein
MTRLKNEQGCQQRQLFQRRKIVIFATHGAEDPERATTDREVWSALEGRSVHHRANRPLASTWMKGPRTEFLR